MKSKALSKIVAAVFLMAAFAFATPKAAKVDAAQNIPAFPGTLINARFVYVTSYDGDHFNPRLLPEDRNAISAVQDAMQKWGQVTLVFQPQQADIILMVMSRPTEDVLAVYDARGWPRNEYLWRMMGRNGLQASETPFVNDLEKAFDRVKTK